MVKVIKTFECSYCNERFDNKADAIEHENSCFYNTKRKQCSTCNHCRIHYGSHEYSDVVQGYTCRLTYDYSESGKRNCKYYVSTM